MKVCLAVNFRIETMAVHDEFANKRNNTCFIGLGSVGASEPLHSDRVGHFVVRIAQPSSHWLKKWLRYMKCSKVIQQTELMGGLGEPAGHL